MVFLSSSFLFVTKIAKRTERRGGVADMGALANLSNRRGGSTRRVGEVVDTLWGAIARGESRDG